MIGAYFYENEESTKRYILPNNALKTKYKDAYRCCSSTCNQSLVLCKGIKVSDYFRHFKDTTCVRYDKPQFKNDKIRKHDEAKLQLQSWIEEGKRIRIKRRCCHCTKEIYQCYTHSIDIFTKVVLEHRFIFNDRNIFYDIAHLNHENEIIEAFEIFDTHKTEEENRPENIKWFEISSKEIMEIAMENKEKNNDIILNNERTFKCEECVTKAKKKKIQDDICIEEIRCTREAFLFIKQQENYANIEARLLKDEYDANTEARLLKEKEDINMRSSMINKIDFEEYITYLDRKLNYDEYKRFKELKKLYYNQSMMICF